MHVFELMQIKYIRNVINNKITSVFTLLMVAMLESDFPSWNSTWRGFPVENSDFLVQMECTHKVGKSASELAVATASHS